MVPHLHQEEDRRNIILSHKQPPGCIGSRWVTEHAHGVQKIPADLECRVRFKIGLELRLELASRMISATLKYLVRVLVRVRSGV